MTYRSKAVGKRRRDEGVTERWASRNPMGRGMAGWARVVSRLVARGLPPPAPPARVRKRSGYRPSKERLRRLAKKARLAAYRRVYEGMMRIHWDRLARPRRWGHDE